MQIELFNEDFKGILLNLGDEILFKGKPRPNARLVRQYSLDNVAQKIALEIKKDFPSKDESIIRDDVRGVIRWNTEDEDIVEAMEKMGYKDVDVDFWWNYFWDEEKTIIKKWVMINEITPKYKLGEQVSFTYRREDFQGEVTNIDTEYAQYTIFIPSKGHVKEGVGTHGTIYDFEEVER